MRNGAFLGLAAGLSLWLSACGGKEPEAAATAEPAMASVPGISVSDARVQLPIVTGRPGVAYFTISQASGAPRKIVGVSVELAGKADMHQSMTDGAMASMKPLDQVALEPGKTVKFEPGGNHVMLGDLDPKLRFSDSVRLSVNLDDGSKAEAAAKVTVAGDGLDKM